MGAEGTAAVEDVLARLGGKDLAIWHRANPRLSADSYLRAHRKLLRAGLAQTSVVYLDTNYWVQLRDAMLGRPRGPEIAGLLTLLREQVRGRKVVCVGHASSFLEIAKQGPESLRATSQLFDELSEGVVIAPPDECRYWEAGDFVFDYLGIDRRYDFGYWSKIGQVLSSSLPAELWKSSSAPVVDAVAKAVLDTLWNSRLQDVFAVFDWDARAQLDAGIDALTIANVEAHKAAMGRRDRAVVRVEAFGQAIAEYYAEPIARHLQRCNIVEGLGWTGDELRLQQEACITEAKRRFRANEVGRYLSTAAIQSELYSLYEIDVGRPLRQNDWSDWEHAAAALPHSHTFLTERHLANQLTNVLHLDRIFDCEVVSDSHAALAAIERLGAK